MNNWHFVKVTIALKWDLNENDTGRNTPVKMKHNKFLHFLLDVGQCIHQSRGCTLQFTSGSVNEQRNVSLVILTPDQKIGE